MKKIVEQMNYEYTINMQKYFRCKLDRLGSLYCKEDFEAEYDRVTKANKDNIKFRMRDFKKMCKTRNIDADKAVEDKKYWKEQLKSILTLDEMFDFLLEFFHSLCLRTPDTADHMERNVRKLASEYSKDTVRTAILKKYIEGTDNDLKYIKVSGIKKIAESRMDKEEKDTYKKLKKDEKTKFLLQFIDDSIFDEYLEIELDDMDKLMLVSKRSQAVINDENTLRSEKPVYDIELSDETRSMISGLLKNAGISHDESTLSYELVSMLENACVTKKTDIRSKAAADTVKMIYDDFTADIKNITYINKKNVREKVTTAFKDDVKYQKRKRNADTQILELCNDLANGYFKNYNNGKTREELYCFAIMFGMTIELREGEKIDAEKDLVKNLFEDYYNDNILRFMQEEFADSDFRKSLEKVPTGEGINFKNYVETVYIYYICRTDLELRPGERIKRAEWMIDEIEKAAKKRPLSAVADNRRTVVYRENYISHIMTLTDENEVIDYIVNNYTIIPEGETKVSRIMAASEKYTAYDCMIRLYSDIEFSYNCYDFVKDTILTGDIQHDKMILEQESTYKLFTDDNKFANALRSKYSDEEDFLRLLNNITDRVNSEYVWIGVNKRDILLRLLHILYHNSSESKMIKSRQITNTMVGYEMYANGGVISECAEILSFFGFDIKKDKGKDHTDKNSSYYALGKREYDDELLNEIIEKIKDPRCKFDKALERAADTLIKAKAPKLSCITRNQLILAYANYFVSYDDYREDPLMDICMSFVNELDKILMEARFQTFSEKNIFDMFIFLSVIYYTLNSD